LSRPNSKKHSGNKIEIKIELTYAFSNRIPVWESGRSDASEFFNKLFTSYDNPKGNADTERMMRTIKEEVIWLHEFTSLTEAKEVIRDWIAKYNREYVHSALGYLSPLEFVQKFYQNYCQEAA